MSYTSRDNTPQTDIPYRIVQWDSIKEELEEVKKNIRNKSSLNAADEI